MDVWLHNPNDTSLVVPKNQLIVSAGKLKMGDGRKTVDQLQTIGETSSEVSESSGTGFEYYRKDNSYNPPGIYKDFTLANGVGQTAELVEDDVWSANIPELENVVSLDPDTGLLVVNRSGEYQCELYGACESSGHAGGEFVIALVENDSGATYAQAGGRFVGVSAGSDVSIENAWNQLKLAGEGPWFGYLTWKPFYFRMYFEAGMTLTLAAMMTNAGGTRPAWGEVDIYPLMIEAE